MRKLSNKISRTKFLLGVFFVGWISYFAYLWKSVLFFNKTGDLVAGNVNVWGDWAAHFTITTALYQRGVFIESPFLLGAKFSYPFFADLISACLLHLGFSFSAAFLLPSFLLSVFLLISLYLFYRYLWKSSLTAVVASLIFFFNGGMGFVVFLQDLFKSAQPLNVLLRPPHEYTRIDSLGIKWLSVIDSMIVPQRAFLLGFPIGLFSLFLILFLQQQKLSEQKQRIFFFLTGLLIGTLPIIHTHTFIALFVILSIWSFVDTLENWQNKKSQLQKWFALFLGTALISLPLLEHFILGNLSQHFFRWYPGWLANDYQLNWFVFWWRNWGITPLVAFMSWIFLAKNWHKNRKLFLSLIPFWLLLILINLFLFQPFSWDNTKLLAWVSVGLSGLAAQGLISFWNFTLKQKKVARIALRYLVIFTFVVITFSGAIDAYRILIFPLHSYVMYSAEEIQLAQWVSQHTSKNSIWLTSDQHNHWLYNLTGRQPVMAYRGWLWTYGYNYHPAEEKVITIFSGNTMSLLLMKQLNVRYVVIGPSERVSYDANEAYFDVNFPIIHQSGQTKIYQIY